MALYHKWDVKNDFPYVLQFFSLISDGLGGVRLKSLFNTADQNGQDIMMKVFNRDPEGVIMVLDT